MRNVQKRKSFNLSWIGAVRVVRDLPSRVKVTTPTIKLLKLQFTAFGFADGFLSVSLHHGRVLEVINLTSSE
jgi:hypothetical protein